MSFWPPWDTIMHRPAEPEHVTYEFACHVGDCPEQSHHEDDFKKCDSCNALCCRDHCFAPENDPKARYCEACYRCSCGAAARFMCEACGELRCERHAREFGGKLLCFRTWLGTGYDVVFVDGSGWQNVQIEQLGEVTPAMVAWMEVLCWGCCGRKMSRLEIDEFLEMARLRAVENGYYDAEHAQRLVRTIIDPPPAVSMPRPARRQDPESAVAGDPLVPIRDDSAKEVA